MKPTDLPNLLPKRLLVVRANDRHELAMFNLAAEHALAGPLYVLDGGNCINIYPLARALRQRTASLSTALENVRLARAFTCYQMLALLEGTQPDGAPVLVLDLLSTFYDESVPLFESQRLLANALRQLMRLRIAAPLAVSARLPNTAAASRRPLYDTLIQTAEELC